MAYLVSDATAQVREHMPSFYPDTDPLALAEMNAVHSDIQRSVRLYQAENVDLIGLAAGTREYSLDPTVQRILRATYYSSPASYTPLRETSVDELDYQNPTWRDQPNTMPTRYYEFGGYLGLCGTPDLTTAAGYPFVRLYCTRLHPFTTTSDPLPAHIPTMDAWVWPACARWAAKNHPELMAHFLALAASALTDLERFVNGRLVRAKATANPSYVPPRNL